ncbi:pinensin family lanthipeptide, partial [Xanthovirga aplysinae]
MKKKKLNLGQIKLESFVTSLEDKKAETAKGGHQTHD